MRGTAGPVTRDLLARQQRLDEDLAQVEPMLAELDDWTLDVHAMQGALKVVMLWVWVSQRAHMGGTGAAAALRLLSDLVTSTSPRFLHVLEDLATARQRVAAALPPSTAAPAEV
jgi:hypothetical protein